MIVKQLTNSIGYEKYLSNHLGIDQYEVWVAEGDKPPIFIHKVKRISWSHSKKRLLIEIDAVDHD